MRVVEKGEEVLNFPGVCVLTMDGEGPWVDTETWLNAKDLDTVDPYAYISVAKVRDMGRVIGMVEKEEVEKLTAQVEEYGNKVAELQALVDAYTTIKDAEETLAAA